jgi:hypothetical protein
MSGCSLGTSFICFVLFETVASVDGEKLVRSPVAFAAA